jgi:hypothetical protein
MYVAVVATRPCWHLRSFQTVLARRPIVGEDDYQQVTKLIEAVAERISIPDA